MKFEIGDLVIGKVKDVKPYAAFLQFEDGVSGLLHISEISDDYIRDIEKFTSVGDELKVLILSQDPTNGFLRVSLKKVPADEFYSTHENTSKKIPVLNDDAFSPLKEKLPKWINETLKKAEEDKND